MRQPPRPSPTPERTPPDKAPPDKTPLLQLPSASSGSRVFLPNDHVRMLVELLQPLGPELARRWLAALALVDRGEREAMVAMVERQVAEMYGEGAAAARGPARGKELQVVHPPVQRDGHVEQIVTTYEVVVPATEHRVEATEAPRVASGRARRR